jgi:transcriptional regulator with XRE-family HTH domain
MPTRESPVQRGARTARRLLVRTGEELRTARAAACLSSRHVGDRIGVSHTQILRIERALAPHVDVGVLARFAAVVGYDLAMSIHPAGPPVRDAGHLRLLGRLRERLPPGLQWRTEVPVPIPGDPRSADATIRGPGVDIMVEAETHVGDVQAVERRIAAKQRDLGARRVILLLADTRHHRGLVRSMPWLTERFPIGTRQVLGALARGEDPGGDGLVIL